MIHRHIFINIKTNTIQVQLKMGSMGSALCPVHQSPRSTAEDGQGRDSSIDVNGKARGRDLVQSPAKPSLTDGLGHSRTCIYIYTCLHVRGEFIYKNIPIYHLTNVIYMYKLPIRTCVQNILRSPGHGIAVMCIYILKKKYKHIYTINTGFEKGHPGDPGTKNRDLSLQCTVGLGERRRPPGPGGYTNIYIKIIYV